MTMTSSSRASMRLAGLVVTVAMLAGCGQQAAPAGGAAVPARDTSGSHRTSDGSAMSEAEMTQMDPESDGDESAPAPGEVTHRGGARGPSVAAAMICSHEIADAVRSTFELPALPSAVDGWNDANYTCTYRMPNGELRLSVKDLVAEGPGRAWFDGLRDRLGARTIRGVESLGFPAAETARRGHVLFLKDHKTLLVDATGVGSSDLPEGVNRTEAAYGVAASVIACWTK